MFKLYYLNNTGKGRSKNLIHNYNTINECMLTINNYLKVNNIADKPYRRFWLNESNVLEVDFGSHINFFLIKPTCNKSNIELNKWLTDESLDNMN